MISQFKRCAAVIFVAAFLQVPRPAAGKPNEAAPPTPQELQAQLQQQQERIQRLEALVRQQNEILGNLSRQLTDHQQGNSASPTGSTPATPTGNEAAPMSEIDRITGELDAVAENNKELHTKVATLEKNLDSATSAGVAGWDSNHPFIRSRDGNLTMAFGGRLHFDWRSYTGTATPPSTFLVRRARLETEGRLFRHYEYRVQLDFAETGGRLLRDGFLNINYTQPFQLQFGHFKAPFSQEELQTSKYIDFVERSSVNNLVPARSPGLMVHGKLAGGAMEYYAGAFNARRDLNLNSASTPEGYLRLRFAPFRSSGPLLLQNFSFGGTFADGRHRGDSSFVGQTASRSVTFFKAVAVNGEIVRANAEFWWRYRNFSLRGEYDQTNQYRENLGPDGANLPGVVGKGLVLQATYLLTGEEKTESGITPKMNFLGGQSGLGAWELAFRYENLQMHDSVKPNRAEAFTFGVNWWLTKFVRYQSNFVLERFKDPARAATPGQTDHFAYLSRMQVIF